VVVAFVVGGFNGVAFATVGVGAVDVDGSAPGSAVEVRVSVVGVLVVGTLVSSAFDTLDFSFVVCVFFSVCEVGIVVVGALVVVVGGLVVGVLVVGVLVVGVLVIGVLVVGILVVGGFDVGVFFSSSGVVFDFGFVVAFAVVVVDGVVRDASFFSVLIDKVVVRSGESCGVFVVCMPTEIASSKLATMIVCSAVLHLTLIQSLGSTIAPLTSIKHALSALSATTR